MMNSMRTFPALVALTATFLMATLPTTTTAQETEPTVAVEPLRGGLHLLRGRGGNVLASVGFDGVLLVDDDYAQYAEAYKRAINVLTDSKLSPGFLINTHWHNDHTGSNEFWARQGTVILGHSNVRQRMSSVQVIEAIGSRVEASPESARPMVTYSDSIALHFNNDDIEVQHYPSGHTDGDSVVYFSQQNVVHMGDLFFNDAFPFVDLSSGGSLEGYIENVRTVFTRIDEKTLIVPGHGPLANKEDLQRFLDMLTTTSEAVRAEIKMGKSVDEITKAGLGQEWSSWGGGFINEEAWIATIVQSSIE